MNLRGPEFERSEPLTGYQNPDRLRTRVLNHLVAKCPVWYNALRLVTGAL
jgi:hypothetical protein